MITAAGFSGNPKALEGHRTRSELELAELAELLTDSELAECKVQCMLSLVSHCLQYRMCAMSVSNLTCDHNLSAGNVTLWLPFSQLTPCPLGLNTCGKHAPCPAWCLQACVNDLPTRCRLFNEINMLLLWCVTGSCDSAWDP